MTRRATVYARVSSDEQRSNYSIPTQVAESLKYAEEAGYSIVGDQWVDAETGQDAAPGNGTVRAYVDDYTSRELNRPGLDAALQFLETMGEPENTAIYMALLGYGLRKQEALNILLVKTKP